LQLNFLNKATGAVVWAIVVTFIFSTCLFYINNLKLLSEKVKSESIVYERIEPLAPEISELIGKIIPPVKDIFHSMQEWFEKQALKNTPPANATETGS
ncbi:MAG: hypothetical protein H7X71_05485, partial [Chitinophagales bacterium]|nr:hypothetical protein [Chitinophagales bacterium]